MSLSSCIVFLISFGTTGRRIVPVTCETAFFPMNLGLLMIDLSKVYFVASCKANDADIFTFSTSSVESMIP